MSTYRDFGSHIKEDHHRLIRHLVIQHISKRNRQALYLDGPDVRTTLSFQQYIDSQKLIRVERDRKTFLRQERKLKKIQGTQSPHLAHHSTLYDYLTTKEQTHIKERAATTVLYLDGQGGLLGTPSGGYIVRDVYEFLRASRQPRITLALTVASDVRRGLTKLCKYDTNPRFIRKLFHKVFKAVNYEIVVGTEHIRGDYQRTPTSFKMTFCCWNLVRNSTLYESRPQLYVDQDKEGKTYFVGWPEELKE